MVNRKHSKFATQVWRLNRYALALLMLVVLTACSPTPELTQTFPTATSKPTQTPATATPDLVPLVLFPKQPAVEGEREMLEALLIGDLIVIDKSLFVVSSHFQANVLPIWPPDYNLDTSSEPYQVLDGNGAVVARVGDEVSIGGGEINAPSGFRESIQVNIPGNYSGPYWWVGKVVDSQSSAE